MHSKLDLSGQQFKAQSKAQRLVFFLLHCNENAEGLAHR